MRVWRVQVEYANGDDFTASRQMSEVEVEADTEMRARLLAQQMVSTPMLGKPSHIQITRTEVQ